MKIVNEIHQEKGKLPLPSRYVDTVAGFIRRYEQDSLRAYDDLNFAATGILRSGSSSRRPMDKDMLDCQRGLGRMIHAEKNLVYLRDRLAKLSSAYEQQQIRGLNDNSK